MLYLLFFKYQHCSAKYESNDDGDVGTNHEFFFKTIRSFKSSHNLSTRCA